MIDSCRSNRAVSLAVACGRPTAASWSYAQHVVTLCWGLVLKSFVNGLHAVLQAVAHAEEQLGTLRQEGETQDSPKSQMNVSCMSLLSAICMQNVSQGCSVHMSCTPSWPSLDGCRCFYS